MRRDRIVLLLHSERISNCLKTLKLVIGMCGSSCLFKLTNFS